MRKLIFAACKQYWENDINVIEMYDLRELLLELRQLYPNTKRLRKALDNVVATINRQNFYSFIADTIMGELAYLYQYDGLDSNNDKEGEDEEDTQLIKAKSKTSQPAKETATPNYPELTVDKETMVSQHSAETAEKPTVAENVEVVSSNVPEGQVIPWLKVDNLFELKQEIMQYTNPLRAKVILFYAIYQIDTSEQHWSIVRTCTLDDLLIRMFQHHGKDIDKIESQLMNIANSSIEGLEPEDNLQTVSAIVESIKHFYKKR
jgi:hypothetical protein